MSGIKREGACTIIDSEGKDYQFHRKLIYLPDELEKAIATHLSGSAVIVLAMNGYSDLNQEKCDEYGIKIGAYETACAALLSGVIQNLQNTFRGVQVKLVHGASDMGVDKAVVNVGLKFNLPQLGFSCPEYMPYVKDDDIPVYVATDAVAYCEAFTSALDILITANGRKTTFEMDIDAVFKKHKDVIPVNILRSISINGGPPAIGRDGKIEDAVALWYLKMHHVSVGMGITGIESWDLVNQRVRDTTKHICRQLMPSNRAFGYDWHK